MLLHINRKLLAAALMFGLISGILLSGCENTRHLSRDTLQQGFQNPPDSTRPGVYWYFMDGNLSREAMTADLESMKKAGIGNLVFLEVNVGVPRGPVDFFSEQWQELFAHAVHEAQRLGIEITLGVGPGWTGSGGPWVKPQQSMLHLVASSVNISGPAEYDAVLPLPQPRRPYFGERVFTEELRQQWQDYYEDVYVLAFPAPPDSQRIADVDEKALYYRAPYTSHPGVKPFLPAPANFPATRSGAAVASGKIIDLSKRLQPDGRLQWQVPPGKWTVMRLGTRNNGAVTRPAPLPGLGFEANKFDRDDFDAHFEQFVGKLLKKTGTGPDPSDAGLTMLHMDSWEMGAQNWTTGFRESFQSRRGYDPLPYLPVYTGLIVDNLEMSERFLWDVRLTAQELVLENHARYIKELARKYGLGLSIEPYDMNPCSDLDLGAVADVPMCEFWSKGFGFNSAFSCFEAASIAHVNGLPVVAAEAFTANRHEAWQLYPGAMKNQGDWAFCVGVNRFVYHTFAHKPLGEIYRPGMTMGPYGVHWDRGQTWWPMVSAYHRYIARCSYLLQQGNTVADILYLTPEGAPHVFRPPESAIAGNDTIPDRRGYNFDACSPLMLMQKAGVKNNRIVFPGGASYHLMVLPDFETMTPELVNKLVDLVGQGATICGNPPVKSPSLAGYPLCDEEVKAKAETLWGSMRVPDTITKREFGKGKIYWGNSLFAGDSSGIYPHYDTTAALLKKLALPEDFISSGPVRYTHRRTADFDIYFLANREDRTVTANCRFRSSKGDPELWDPVNGEIRPLPEFERQDGHTVVPLKFAAHQSYFIAFDRKQGTAGGSTAQTGNFDKTEFISEIAGPWQVCFDTLWGGPERLQFQQLTDWSKHPDDGIKYYSGTAVYSGKFDLPLDYTLNDQGKLYLNLGEVCNIARVRLNGRDLGVVWTAPWQVRIDQVVKADNNQLEIEVANLWPNRLIGDEQFPFDGITEGKWPDWLAKGEPRTSGRFTFTTSNYYIKDFPLLKSGLLGPVRIMSTLQQ
jgi:hypothetical protein